MRTITLQIHGYYIDSDRKWMPATSGLFFVYKGRLNEEHDKAILLELIYIGESSNINSALNEHPRRNDFLASCKKDEILFYSYAELLNSEEERVSLNEAIVSVILPSYNDRNQGQINKEGLTVIVEGPHAYIPSSMVIGKTEL